jgi:hypothetical protein
MDHETSPRIPTIGVGGLYPGQQAYRSWFESHGTRIGDATHQAPRAENGVSTTNPPAAAAATSTTATRVFLSSGPYFHTEQLQWIMNAVQLPLQQNALQALRQCLLSSPDVTRALHPSGETPFSRLANIFWQQLEASDGRLGPEPVWELTAGCLRQFLILGADPDVLVGGRPFLIRILEQPSRTRSFGPLWPFVCCLAAEASPLGHHHGLNALHALLLAGNETGSAVTPTEASLRVHLTKLLITRVAEVGRLADHNAAGLTALQQYVYHTSWHDTPENVLAICADLVRHEGSSGSVCRSHILSPSLAADLRSGKLPPSLHDDASAARLLPIVWASACQMSLAGDGAAAEEHLDVVLCCTGGRFSAEELRAMLPRPVVVAPMALPSPVSPLPVSPRADVKYVW